MSLLLLFNGAGAPGNSQALAATLDDVTAAIAQAAGHSQALAVTLDSITVAVSQLAAGGKAQALAVTLDGITAAVSQAARHPQALAATLDDVAVAITQTGTAAAAAPGGDWMVRNGGRRIASVGYNPLLRRILAARADQEARPLKKKARQKARVIEVEAAEVALASGNEEQFRALMDQWLAQRPIAAPAAPSVDLQQLFMARVALRVQQIEALEQDDEEALLLMA